MTVKNSNPRWALVALRRSFVWKGRARRAEAWWYMGLFVATLTLIYLIMLAAGDSASSAAYLIPAAALYTLIGLVPGVACAIRRLHDLDRSGWWYLLVFITMPLAIPVGIILIDSPVDTLSYSLVLAILASSGALTLLYWFLQRGTIGENRFGPDPLMTDESRSPSPAISIGAVHIRNAGGLR